MTDKAFLEQIEAREKLQARGYWMKSCTVCKGTCFDEDRLKKDKAHGIPMPTAYYSCDNCGAVGYTWVKE